MKRILALAFALVFAALMLSACGSKTIKSPYSASDYVGMNYQSARSSLSDTGFANITLSPAEDLEFADSARVGSIESVSIGGNGNYSTQDALASTSSERVYKNRDQFKNQF